MSGSSIPAAGVARIATQGISSGPVVARTEFPPLTLSEPYRQS